MTSPAIKKLIEAARWISNEHTFSPMALFAGDFSQEWQKLRESIAAVEAEEAAPSLTTFDEIDPAPTAEQREMLRAMPLMRPVYRIPEHPDIFPAPPEDRRDREAVDLLASNGVTSQQMVLDQLRKLGWRSPSDPISDAMVEAGMNAYRTEMIPPGHQYFTQWMRAALAAALKAGRA